MDTFMEQLVVRKQTALDLYKRAGLLVGGLLAIFLVLTVLPGFPGIVGQVFSAISIFVVAGMILGIYYAMSSLALEYEYILTGAELDIDKIIGKRRRKRVLSITTTTVTEIGLYAHKKNKSAKGTLIAACAAVSDPDTYYLTFHDQKQGNGILLFTPNEKLLKELKRYIKHTSWTS